MKLIHIIDEQVHHSARNSVTGKRGHVQRRPIAGQAHVAGIRFCMIEATPEVQAEAGPGAIEETCRTGIVSLNTLHGGPRAASTEGFGLFPQLLASHGYVVFSPNYRGSDNLGNAYGAAT
jgi:hypothetical protein